MAIANEFELLLLDEPVAGVQPRIREELLKLIESLHGTIILVEHNTDFIKRLSSRVLFLNHGTIVAEGDYSAIRANPQVREAYS